MIVLRVSGNHDSIVQLYAVQKKSNNPLMALSAIVVAVRNQNTILKIGKIICMYSQKTNTGNGE